MYAWMHGLRMHLFRVTSANKLLQVLSGWLPEANWSQPQWFILILWTQ